VSEQFLNSTSAQYRLCSAKRGLAGGLDHLDGEIVLHYTVLSSNR